MAADPGVVTFVNGLPGFETCRRFVLMSAPTLEPFVYLNALDAPQPSFLMVDPRLIMADYQMPLTDADRRRLDAGGDDALLWLAMVRIGDGEAAVNLQAPIVVNPRRMVGLQVVGADSDYPAGHPLPGL